MASKRLAPAALLAALALLGAACSNSGDAPEEAAPEEASTPTPEEPPVCPLTGAEAEDAALVERPAVGIKIENNPSAYPLSGLEDAEVVYEELVEGGITRFLALYHCTDAKVAGPVRSSREIDPGIMVPVTRILGAAGGNAPVRKALKKGDIVLIDEDAGKPAMVRRERPGISAEHTLYANTVAVRKQGSKKYADAPPEDTFSFGDIVGTAKDTKSVTLIFSNQTTVEWRWAGNGWQRFDDGRPLPLEAGGKVLADNVIIEQHTVNYSKTIVDVAGNPSIVLADETGKGSAVLLRDGQAIKGRWIRDSRDSAVRFETNKGEQMNLAPGVTWIELLPNNKGELKGSYTLSKK